MSLNEAHLLMEEADRYALKHDYANAISFQEKSIKTFLDVYDKTSAQQFLDPKVSTSLKLLIEQQESRLAQLKLQHEYQKKKYAAMKEHKKNKKDPKKSNKSSTAFIGDYSIINDFESISSGNSNHNNSGNTNDYVISNLHSAVMKLFDALEINIELQSSDSEDGAPNNVELNQKLLAKKTKEELIIENQQLKANVVHMTKLLRKLNFRSEKNLVLMDKEKFQKSLTSLLAISANSTAMPGNSRPGGFTSKLSSRPENASLSNQILAEKEAEINRLQQLIRTQEHKFRSYNDNLANYTTLQNDYSTLQKKLSSMRRTNNTNNTNLIIQSDDDDEEDDDDDDDNDAVFFVGK